MPPGSWHAWLYIWSKWVLCAHVVFSCLTYHASPRLLSGLRLKLYLEAIANGFIPSMKYSYWSEIWKKKKKKTLWYKNIEYCFSSDFWGFIWYSDIFFLFLSFSSLFPFLLSFGYLHSLLWERKGKNLGALTLSAPILKYLK